ncbi:MULTISPECIES: restriction endonuclease subunit S [Enterobacteriaceae]|uniref:restriction endonuclease subunit S n=1 Tax=Enterobacteriaceae TaxID=543 RepID=UPI00259DEA72|nr:restriction endonuclease subunit S [Citrobacter freundii]HCM5959532.1 restriction endonuclease subunit S [Klebsiella quasipneumoniae]EIJ8977012.1 restriction endonuclease subunit S [Citrobacter freundii]EJD5383733.1 restriction endonuclease subunit S [Citrobacter freundii]EJG9713782.1 restriction endonuclease subunit S [Citrobacter freundii]
MSWPMVNLGSIGKFKAGFGFPIEYQGKKEGDYPFAKVGDISAIVRSGHKNISHAGNYIDKDILDNLKAKTIPKGTIVFAKIGEAIKQNFRAITTVEMVIDNNVMGLVPDNNLVDTNYLFYFMRSLDLYQFSGATTIPALRKSTLENIQIPLPPLSEQKRIAAILDKADDIRQKREQAIELADDFLRSTFLEMFGDPVSNPKGWKVKPLKELSVKIASGSTPKGGSKVYVDKGITFFRSQNVWKNDIRLDDVAYIDEKTHNSLKKSSLKHKDILMTKTGRFNTENSSLGRAALFLGDDDSANVNGHVYLIRLKAGVLHEFIVYILTSNEYREHIREVCVGGIDKRQLNKEHIEDFPIIYPPDELQMEFIRKLNSIQKIRSNAMTGLKELIPLFNTLNQKAFSDGF